VFVSVYVCEQILCVKERKKSENVAWIVEYHLSTFLTPAASTVAPNFGKLLNSRCQQHSCNGMVTAGTRICIQVNCDLLLVERRLKLCSSLSGPPKRPETCFPSLQLESPSVPSVGSTSALKTLV